MATTHELNLEYLRYLGLEWTKSGKTQVSLAHETDVSTATISDFLHKGAGMHADTAERLARALRVSPEDLPRLAREHAERMPAPTPVKLDRNALGRARGWAAAVESAKRQHPDIPPEFFEQASMLSLPGGPPEEIDTPFVAGIARELRDLRWRRHANKSGERARDEIGPGSGSSSSKLKG